MKAPDNHSHVVRPDNMEWQKTRFEGCEVKNLMFDKKSGMATALMRLAPGAVLLRTFGPVAQACGARPLCPREPGSDGMQQRAGIFALRHQRSDDAQTIGITQHQQHALGADELGCGLDHGRAQGVAVAKRKQAQPGVDQALN